jgi:hypothetical protein
MAALVPGARQPHGAALVPACGHDVVPHAGDRVRKMRSSSPHMPTTSRGAPPTGETASSCAHDATVESFAAVASDWVLGRIELTARRPVVVVIARPLTDSAPAQARRERTDRGGHGGELPACPGRPRVHRRGGLAAHCRAAGSAGVRRITSRLRRRRLESACRHAAQTTNSGRAPARGRRRSSPAASGSASGSSASSSRRSSAATNLAAQRQNLQPPEYSRAGRARRDAAASPASTLSAIARTVP